MIRFRCPKCAKKLGVDDSRLGEVVICPGCQGRLRIPVRKNGEEPGQAVYKISRPTGEEEPFPPVRRRKRAEDEDGPSSDSEAAESRPVPRRRKKRRKTPAGLPWGLDGFVAAILGVAVVGLVSLVLAWIWPTATFMPLGLGLVLIWVGAIWFLVMAFQDSLAAGLLCLFVPFYGLYYLVTHFDEVKRPFLVQLLGVVVVMVGSCTGAFSGRRSSRAPTNTGKMPNLPNRAASLLNVSD
jgi:hypothetical protein